MKQEIDEVLCPLEYVDKKEGRDYGTVEHITYFSKTTNRERGMNVVLPAGYEKGDKSYPVLYLTHAIFGDEYVMLKDPNYRIIEILVNLAAEGKTREMIIVFPHIYVTSDPNLQPGFTPEAVQPYDNFIDELIDDIEPYITEHYHTLTGRENRFLFGFSMGARETIYIGVKRPDLFAYFGGVAPAPGITPGKDWAMEHQGMLEENEFRIAERMPNPELFLFCCGTKDSVVQKFPASYHEVLTRNGVEHVWYEVPEADHDENAMRSGLYNFAIRLL